MAVQVEFRDNTNEVIGLFHKAKHRGLEAIGLAAEGHAKKKLTKEVYTGDKDWPLTGRLRNSITYAIAGYQTHVKDYRRGNVSGGASGKHKRYEYSDQTMDGEKDSAVYIGTNVEYAPGIELGTHRKAGAVHFLQDAASNHGAEYKRLMEDSMRNA